MRKGGSRRTRSGAVVDERAQPAGELEGSRPSGQDVSPRVARTSSRPGALRCERESRRQVRGGGSPPNWVDDPLERRVRSRVVMRRSQPCCWAVQQRSGCEQAAVDAAGRGRPRTTTKPRTWLAAHLSEACLVTAVAVRYHERCTLTLNKLARARRGELRERRCGCAPSPPTTTERAALAGSGASSTAQPVHEHGARPLAQPPFVLAPPRLALVPLPPLLVRLIHPRPAASPSE